MNLSDEIFTRAVAMTGETDPQQCLILKSFSVGANASIAAGLRPDIDFDACRELFIAAGSLYAAAAYLEADENNQVERFTVGDVTVQRKNSSEGANIMRQQADQMLAPYRSDSFSFRGV